MNLVPASESKAKKKNLDPVAGTKNGLFRYFKEKMFF